MIELTLVGCVGAFASSLSGSFGEVLRGSAKVARAMPDQGITPVVLLAPQIALYQALAAVATVFTAIGLARQLNPPPGAGPATCGAGARNCRRSVVRGFTL
jgi:hypothetical protein